MAESASTVAWAELGEWAVQYAEWLPFAAHWPLGTAASHGGELRNAFELRVGRGLDDKAVVNSAVPRTELMMVGVNGAEHGRFLRLDPLVD